MPDADLRPPVTPDTKAGQPSGVIILRVQRRLIVGSFIVAPFLGTVIVLVLAAHVFARIAPEESPEAMGALVAWVWLYHVVKIARRRHPIGRGLLRAAAFATLTGILIGAGLLLTRH